MMGSHSQRVLLAAGSNAKGQLGIGSHDDAHTFTPCRFASTERDADRTEWKVSQIACGANHTVLLLEHADGSTELWGAGDGKKGQLGLEVDENECAETGLGAGDLGQAVVTGSSESAVFRRIVLPEVVSPEPSLIGNVTPCYTPRIVGAAWETTYVVLRSPRSDTHNSDPGSDRDRNMMDCGSDVLLSMGSNDFGALAIGDSKRQQHRSQGTVAAELRGSLVGDATVTATTLIGTPHVVPLDHVLPDDSSGRPRSICVRSLHAGPRHVVVELRVTHSASDSKELTSRTILVGWGACRHGQLGQDLCGARFIACPTLLPIDIHDDPMVSCALGNQHTVVLHTSGRISTLGSNKQGQISSPLRSLGHHICKLGCTWNGTYLQSYDGDGHVLLSTGNNAQGQLGRSSTTSVANGAVDLPAGRAISTFACGSEHVLCVISGSSYKTDSVFGWGWNEHGNMGLGNVGNVPVPTQLWPREDIQSYSKYPQRVIGTWAGCATSWLLVE